MFGVQLADAGDEDDECLFLILVKENSNFMDGKHQTKE